MRKLLSAFVFCLLVATTAFGQIVGETSQQRLKGPIKSVKVERAKVSEDNGKATEGPRVLVSEYLFDSKRRLVESLICNSDGAPYVKYRAIYTDAGKAEETYHKLKGDLIDKMVYTYGPDGRLIEKTVEKARKSPTSKATFSYDDRGRIIEKISRNTKDKDGFKLVYSYDDAQSKIEYVSYDLKGTQIVRAIQRYDNQRRLIEEESYKEAGSHPVSIWSFAYDGHGNIAEETLQLLGGVIKWRYEYQADSFNNWTKRITYSYAYKDGASRKEPVEATYRTITYEASSSESPVGNATDLASVVVTRETNSYLPGDAVRRQQPEYPADAKQRRQAGKITVHILVDESGQVVSARAEPSKAELLRGAATFAARAWRLNPTVSGGIAVRVIGPVTFTFSL